MPFRTCRRTERRFCDLRLNACRHSQGPFGPSFLETGYYCFANWAAVFAQCPTTHFQLRHGLLRTLFAPFLLTAALTV